MRTLKRIAPTIDAPLSFSRLDEAMEKLGFNISSPQTFSKLFTSPNANLRIDLSCDPDTVTRFTSTLAVQEGGDVTKSLRQAELVSGAELRSLVNASMVREAASMGMPGGMGSMHNLNLPTDFPGPRWWPMDLQEKDIDELQSWIRGQDRYNPEYMAIGDARNSGRDRGHHVANLPPNVQYARLARDRQEPVIEYTLPNGQKRKEKLEGADLFGRVGMGRGDIAQELDKYQVRLEPMEDHTEVHVSKVDNGGDVRGIWQINGPSSVPGYGFVWEDMRAGYSLHPELLDSPEWASGRWSPGTQRWHKPYGF